MKIPTIKKKISAFLLKDDGKISKQSLLAIGAILSSATLASIISSENVLAACPKPHYVHTNDINNVHAGTSHQVQHSHHGSHCSHGSHGSHASHGSHGQW